MRLVTWSLPRAGQNVYSESLSLDEIYQNIMRFRGKGCVRILRPLCGYATGFTVTDGMTTKH